MTLAERKTRPVLVGSVISTARAHTDHFEWVLQGAVVLHHGDGPSDNPIYCFHSIEGLCTSAPNQGRKGWKCMHVPWEDTNTYPQLMRWWGDSCYLAALNAPLNPSPTQQEIVPRQLNSSILTGLGAFWSSGHLLRARPPLFLSISASLRRGPAPCSTELLANKCSLLLASPRPPR